jgi:uncharacterized protein (TIGR02466 family)
MTTSPIGTRKDFFVTPVYSFNVSSSQREQWLKTINELKLLYPKDPSVPLFRGHKIQLNLFNDSRFDEFKTIVLQNALSIASDLNIDLNRMEIKLDHAWASINKKGDFNEFHSHSNCDLSGTYYLQSMPSLGSLRFRDPREPVLLRTPLLTKPNLFSKEVIFPPTQGMMYIFPSWLVHQVDPNPVDFERISLSFNISFAIKSELHGTIQREW